MCNAAPARITPTPPAMATMTMTGGGGQRDAVESMRDRMDAADSARRSFTDEVKRRYQQQQQRGEDAPWDEVAASAAALELEPDECGSLESDEDESESESECAAYAGAAESTTASRTGGDETEERNSSGQADDTAETTNMGCLRAAARHYPILASLTGLGGSSAPPPPGGGAPTKVVLLPSASSNNLPPPSPLRKSRSASLSAVTSRTRRRRIHPRKSIQANVSFSELVSVKEITRYAPNRKPHCFYTAEEMQQFRHDYLLGKMHEDDEDVFEMLQDLADGVCCYVKGMLWNAKGGARSFGLAVASGS